MLAILIGAQVFPDTIGPLAYLAIGVIGSVAGAALGVLGLIVKAKLGR